MINILFSIIKRHSVYFELSPSDLHCCKGYNETVFTTAYQIRETFEGGSLEKEMVTHSSILAWKIPWTEEPGELQSMGLQE